MMHHELFLRDNGKRKMRQSLILLQSLEKIDTLMKNDDELIRLRTNIRKSAEAKVANGTLTVTEMLREVTAEDQAKQTKALHEIQRLQALYDIKYTMNH